MSQNITKKENKMKDLSLFLISLVLLLSAWEWSVNSGYLNIIFFSKPSSILHEFLNLLKSGELINHLTITLQEVFIGFFIGIFAGIGMGLLFRWKQTLAKIFLPYIQFLYSTPYVAIVPLLMLWVGIDLFFKIASVVIAVLPIMTIQTYEGTR